MPYKKEKTAHKMKKGITFYNNLTSETSFDRIDVRVLKCYDFYAS